MRTLHWMMVLTPLVMGCDGDDPKSGSSDSDHTVPDREDADADTDTDTDSDADADADGGPGDSSVGADCVIETGEWTDTTGVDLGGTAGIYDCGLFCVPEYITLPGHAEAWVGDTMCDDGALGVDLDCEEFLFDGGDCE